LQTTQPEHQTPHRREAMQRQFKPDQKKKKDHAELGNAGHVFGVGDREPRQRRKGLAQRAKP